MKILAAILPGIALGALPAAASGAVPSQMWLGVERIAVNCRFDASVRPQLRDALCRQLRAEAQRLTGYPVTLATRRDLDPRPPGLAGPANQLLINIHARLAGGKDGAQSLVVSVLPERAGGRTWRGPWSRPSPVRLSWSGGRPAVQGPVRPLQMLLFEPRRRTRQPPFPVRSD